MKTEPTDVLALTPTGVQPARVLLWMKGVGMAVAGPENGVLDDVFQARGCARLLLPLAERPSFLYFTLLCPCPTLLLLSFVVTVPDPYHRILAWCQVEQAVPSRGSTAGGAIVSIYGRSLELAQAAQSGNSLGLRPWLLQNAELQRHHAGGHPGRGCGPALHAIRQPPMLALVVALSSRALP